MKNYMSRSGLILKYLFSYSIILILPFTAIILYFYPMAEDALTSKIMSNNYQVTAQIKNTMDIQLANIYGVPVQIDGNDKLTPRALGKNVYAGIVAVDEIGNTISTNPFIFDAILYSKSEQTLYSSRTLTPMEKYDTWANTYKYLDWDIAEFSTMLNSQTKPAIFPVKKMQVSGSETRDIITFVFPLLQSETYNYDMVLVLVQNSSFQQLIDVYFNDYNGNVVIMDPQENIITSTNDMSRFSSSDLLAVRDHKPSSVSEIVEMNGDKYIVSHIKSAKNGWSYLSYIPLGELLGDISKKRQDTILMVSVILLIECLLIFVFIRSNYTPIKKLLKDATVYFKPKQGTSNEFHTIHNALKFLSDNNDILDHKVRRATPAIREYILRCLINGQILTVEQFNELGKDIQLSMDYPNYLVTVISFVDDKENTDYRPIEIFFNQLHALEGVQGVQIYSLFDLRKDSIVLVSSQQSEKEAVALLRNIQEKLTSELGFQTLVGISNSANDIQDINFLYLQALSCIEFLELKKSVKLLKMEDLPANFYEFKDYPVETFYHLEVAIMKNDREKIRSVTAELCHFLSTKKMPVYIVRTLYRNITGILINAIIKSSKTMSEQVINQFMLVNVYRIESLVENIGKCADELCSLIEDKSDDNHTPLQNIIHYINDHCLEYDFSIQSVASEFNVSVSNFSHYFKKKTNISFKQYVDIVKINRAKELLVNTEKTLDEITGELTYSNVSSFIRAFKRISNITPGEFRKQYNREA
jgi:two-component system response regulator YesN